MNTTKLLEKLISFKSITPNDDGSFEFVKNYLSDFEIVEINKGGVKNLYISKEFQKDGFHLCFAGHLDVVPPGDGWHSDPFKPTFKNGFIYGRGAQDMKSGVAAFLNALKYAKDFCGKLSIILTSDEEGDAKYGTIEVLKYLKEKDDLPDFAIVAEPTCEMEFGDTIKIGRRGSINGIIEVFGKQGHAAYPQKALNPIHQIAPILPKIAGIDLDSGDEFFAPSKFVITDIRSGMQVTNVTPANLQMMFNVRNSTKTSKEDIKNFINQHFNKIDYHLKLSQSAKPFLTNSKSKIVSAMNNAIYSITGIIPQHSTAGGTSDARFFAEYKVETIEFGVKNDTIHAPNERTATDEVEKLYQIFAKTISLIN